LRILHVVDHSLPRLSGYSIRARYLLEAQVIQGHEVHVLTAPNRGDSSDHEERGLHYHRSRYLPWERFVAEGGGKQGVFGRAIRRSLRDLLDRQRWDIVQGHTPFTVGREALAEARRRGLPFVYEKRNLWEESARARGKAAGRWPFYQIARAIDRRVTRSADAVCTITEALRSHTIGLGVPADRVVVVGNGVDTDVFAPRVAPADLRAACLRGGRFVAGFVGSFFSFEGLPLLLDAFSRVHADDSEVRLVLVGDGEDRPVLERRIRTSGLGAAIWMTGAVPHPQVPDFYAAMDVLVYPRVAAPLTEMISPLKPLEAMAMGRCVVASGVGGLRELIRDGETGLMFEAGSTASLEGCLRRLRSSSIHVRSLGAKARSYVVAERQWGQMAARYVDAYRAAFAARPTP
jgi:PEP-CTERM/exosortase A-associated glycosyltransferase